MNSQKTIIDGQHKQMTKYCQTWHISRCCDFKYNTENYPMATIHAPREERTIGTTNLLLGLGRVMCTIYNPLQAIFHKTVDSLSNMT